MAEKASFLGLPGELRNEIYDLYVSSMTLEVREGAAVPPALTRVNRQIRKEFASILHRQSFAATPVDFHVFNWDMHHVETFLPKLKAHSDGTTRHIKLYINLTRPGAAYSFQRYQWCQDARLALFWYVEDFARWQQFHNHFPSFDCARVRIGDQFLDVEHVFRFPPSEFSIESRGIHPVRAGDFFDLFGPPGSRGSRPRMLNRYLEGKLEVAMERALKARRFIDTYWAKHAIWNEKLKQIQYRAQKEIEAQQIFREYKRRIRFNEVRRALRLFRRGATSDELAELQSLIFTNGGGAQ